MKSFTTLISALLAVAFASPLEKRQDLPIDDYDDLPVLPNIAAPIGDALPQTTSYNPSNVASIAAAVATNSLVPNIVTVMKRNNNCTTRSYNGPQVTSPADDPDSFQGYAPFAASATAAAQPGAIPSGYALVPGFVNRKSSVEDSHYLTYTTKDLDGYKPALCAAKCNVMAGCNAFNIYFERVPLIVNPLSSAPDSQTCPSTSTSPSATLIKCAFWGMPVKASQATNSGQFQGSFRVVIAGSNAYVKSSAPTLPGYSGPVNFGNASINAPAPVSKYGYLRTQTFGQNVPFDPSLCAVSCTAQTAYDSRHNNGSTPCNFFNVYVLTKNGQNGVLSCAYYTTSYGSAFAKNFGQYDSSRAFFGVTQSYGYYLDGHYVD